jgi:hypothetical protein
MYEKTLSIFIALVAVVMLGSGITGFATIEAGSSTFCVENNDCEYSVCCPLANQAYGVCAQQSECDDVYLETATSFQRAPADVAEEAEQSYIAIVLGLILLFIIGFVSYTEWHQGNHSTKKVTKKVKKTNKRVKKKKTKKKRKSSKR